MRIKLIFRAWFHRSWLILLSFLFPDALAEAASYLKTNGNIVDPIQ